MHQGLNKKDKCLLKKMFSEFPLYEVTNYLGQTVLSKSTMHRSKLVTVEGRVISHASAYKCINMNPLIFSEEFLREIKLCFTNVFFNLKNKEQFSIFSFSFFLSFLFLFFSFLFFFCCCWKTLHDMCKLVKLPLNVPCIKDETRRTKLISF